MLIRIWRRLKGIYQINVTVMSRVRLRYRIKLTCVYTCVCVCVCVHTGTLEDPLAARWRMSEDPLAARWCNESEDSIR